MPTLSMRKVAQLATGAGVSRPMLATAVAVAMAESSLNTAAVGDVALVDRTWGPSIGLWQIRSLKAETGTGRPRDANRLKNAEFNARAMFSISASGTNWSPWSTYKDGSYRKYLPAAQKAVNAQLGADPLAGTDLGYTPPSGQKIPAAPKVGARQAGFDGFDLPGPDAMYGLGGIGLGLLGAGKGAIDGLTDDVGTQLRAAALEALLWTAALGLGVSLVLVGTWATVRAGAREAMSGGTA
ncbi:hypothetical protein F9L07_19875 [Pimelobacter simplex]|uniref:Transglycosylase SLT domain-containing protein n=1 Tax=Nocardioides simplex TaxID=2045 RepID=A0A7J5DVI4_NOCSI|nr:hypothetical protein [Pimelobacter simplex]KAB2809301.1 hypothetical protein F9L07_19875 [Pimelobacter simplex]